MAVGRHDSVRNRVSAGIDQPLDGLHDDCLGDHRGAVLPVTSVCARDDDGDETSVYRLAEDELDRRGRSIEPCPVGGTARHERGVRVRRRADEDDERPEQPDRRSRHRAPFSRRHRRRFGQNHATGIVATTNADHEYFCASCGSSRIPWRRVSRRAADRARRRPDVGRCPRLLSEARPITCESPAWSPRPRAASTLTGREGVRGQAYRDVTRC